MLVQETWINQTKGYQCGDSDLYEPYTNDIGELFREYQREYGRCISKMYTDTENGVKAIGWVFEKRVQYQDCQETYLQHTWVTLHKDKPEKTVKYNYQEIQ